MFSTPKILCKGSSKRCTDLQLNNKCIQLPRIFSLYPVLHVPEVDLVPPPPAAVPVEVPTAAPLGLEVPVLVVRLQVQVKRGGEGKPPKGSSQSE